MKSKTDTAQTTQPNQQKPIRLKKEFYQKTAVEAAPLLLGKLLCVNLEGNTVKLRITETEAYMGEEDTACHAHKGKTNRTEIMYKEGGYAYIYLCYGIHSLLNIVTGSADIPQAVLIRGVEGFNGPGKLTKALKITTQLNKENLITSNKLWIEDEGHTPKYTIAKRVGIHYATPEYKEILWRFILEN